MTPKSNYTLPHHLEEYNVPFSSFRAARPQFTHFVGGGLIFSRRILQNSDPEEGNPPLRILLLQRSFEDSYGGHWEGPGGSCEPDDETLLAGVAREVFEESGLRVSRFVEFVSLDRWTKLKPDRVYAVAKFTFIVEVHEVGSDGPVHAQDDRKKEEAALFTDTSDGLPPARWEDAVKLNPEEHRAYRWATEDEIREGEASGIGKFTMLGDQGQSILEAFRLLKLKS
ncbi:hypothetical protein P175DRAFT_0499777 [Aspergillus ochraceoroseus IBT 24754]|uniref:Nudix hydrolase domain-containing protein n=2 Tax=Aspergillus ochraceoroseus TaxID=138278 RepID=A0A2T5M3W8_9EURO|nr:uncharacterized protein P175DRAFT_0499777 [Aspergillus ochraceoroseus IBT 24754]KKK25697.1 hypothetical protein AOCH_005106 [Aspergillus ochraceoroseus]PTU23231.1 hypothetical protein P175DRAFT_0499777 [Aspergillus ochraceoroseus IBT 24754]